MPNPSSTITLLRWITSGTTFLLLILIFIHYYTRLKFSIFKQRVEITATLFSTKLIWFIIIEWFVCLIHSPPYIDNIKIPISTTTGDYNVVEVELDLLLSMLIPARVYLFFRYYSFYSNWADDKAENVCNLCNAMGGISFAIKAELKERPYKLVGLLLILSILVFGYALRNVEVAFMVNVSLDKFQDWRYVWNGMWCIVITILTVGYGDYYPQTHLGRVIAVVACLWGTFLISLMVVSLTVSVEFTPQEEKAYEELKKNEEETNLRKKAMQLIREAYLVGVLYSKLPDNANQTDKKTSKEYSNGLRSFYKVLGEFRVMRKNFISKEHEVSAETILHKLNDNVTEEMEDIINTSNHYVTSLMEYIKISKEIQLEIKNYLDKLEGMTKGLYDCISNKPEHD